jgi:ubiquitin carboxyl-terminal hydrolase MINDY-1/2
MVTRKNSLPYPQSPTASSTQAASTTPASGALFGSALPNAQQSQGSFMDSDNPWQDQQTTTGSGNTQTSNQHQRDHSLTNIPQALRPGGSGQDTPRSSIDSGESRDWWDEDDAGDKSPTRSPVRAARSPERSPARSIPDSLKPRRPSPAVPQIPSPTSIKRKPLPSAQPPPEESPPRHDLGSNNPFRHASSAEAPPPPAAAPPPPPSFAPPPVPEADAWKTVEQEPEDKGKAPVRELKLAASITDFSRMTIGGNVPDPSAYHKVQTPQERDDPWKSMETLQGPPEPPAPQFNAQDDPWKQVEGHSGQPPTAQVNTTSAPRHSLTSQPPLLATSQDSQQQSLHDPWRPDQSNQNPVSADQRPPILSVTSQGGQESGIVRIPEGRSNSQFAPANGQSEAEPSLLDDDEIDAPQPGRPNQSHNQSQSETYAPPPGPPPGRGQLTNHEETPPPKPPRPAIITTPLSDADRAKLDEQRGETYQIKHFNWFDHSSGRLRRSSMLTQNKNGPCPLLALVNALILGARDESQAALDDALRAREQVSLGLIIETLMDELIQRSDNQAIDVEEISAFLMRLRTGMNANPRFIPVREPPPNLMDARHSVLDIPQQQRSKITAGGFEATGDIKLYGSFNVPLLHGWIPDTGSDAEQAFSRSAQTYEDAQAIQFNEEELEYKLTRDGLSQDEQRVWEDITSIKNFFRLHPTQLTETGLERIQQSLSSGSFAILFRNDHFSTVYKHPQSGQLFTLITDAGYADRDEIIWESLVDISGRGNDFFSGDFMPVSHHQANNPSSDRQHLTVQDPTNAPLSPQEQQEQHDADFAMALQLQEEEEQRQRAEQARRRRSGPNATSGGGNLGAQPGRSPRGSSTGNIPITLTSSNQSVSDRPENRPTVPPRRSQGPPAVNRPADANDEDAPPAYEEAAKGRPYIPPVGSPLHPTAGPGAESSISPMSSSAQLTGTIGSSGPSSSSNNLSAHPPGPNAPYYGGGSGGPQQRPGHGRVPSSSAGGSGRLSAYQDQASTPTQGVRPGGWDGRQPSYGSMPGTYQHVGATTGEGANGRRRRGDCVVM